MTSEGTTTPGREEAGGGTVPSLTPGQRARLSQRLSMRSADGDRGGVLPLTARALDLPPGAQRLEALVGALAHERVIVPIEVEADPRDTGVHAGLEKGAGADLASVDSAVGPALAVYSCADALASERARARPMPLSARRVALTALVETSGHVLVDPQGACVLLPRPAVAALAQGDVWLPAWRDPELLAELRALAGCGEATGILDVRVVAGGATTVVVELVVDPRSEGSGARTALARAARAVGTSPRLSVAAERIEIRPLWAHVA